MSDSDITKCEGLNCPLKETCYRFLAKPSEYLQSYFRPPPYEGDNCNVYIECKTPEQKVYYNITSY